MLDIEVLCLTNRTLIKDISEAAGIPMSTIMLQATIENMESDASSKLC
jgi:hypothetical protein